MRSSRLHLSNDFNSLKVSGVVDDRDYTENVVWVHANICCAMLSLCVTIKDISNTGLLVGLFGNLRRVKILGVLSSYGPLSVYTFNTKDFLGVNSVEVCSPENQEDC